MVDYTYYVTSVYRGITRKGYSDVVLSDLEIVWCTLPLEVIVRE